MKLPFIKMFDTIKDGDLKININHYTCEIRGPFGNTGNAIRQGVGYLNL